MSLSSNTISDTFIFDKIHLIHYQFFPYQITMFFPRVRVYIDNGWDKSRLKDPDNGILLLKENVDQEKLEVLQLLKNLPDTNWTTNISKLPLDKIVHSSVENYFKNSNDANTSRKVTLSRRL